MKIKTFALSKVDYPCSICTYQFYR